MGIGRAQVSLISAIWLTFFSPHILNFLLFPGAIYLFTWDSVSPCSFGDPGTDSIDQIGLELTGIQPASISQALDYRYEFMCSMYMEVLQRPKVFGLLDLELYMVMHHLVWVLE